MQFLPKTCGGNAELVPIQDAVIPSKPTKVGGSEVASNDLSSGKQPVSQQNSNSATQTAEKHGKLLMRT